MLPLSTVHVTNAPPDDRLRISVTLAEDEPGPILQDMASGYHVTPRRASWFYHHFLRGIRWPWPQPCEGLILQP